MQNDSSDSMTAKQETQDSKTEKFVVFSDFKDNSTKINNFKNKLTFGYICIGYF